MSMPPNFKRIRCNRVIENGGEEEVEKLVAEVQVELNGKDEKYDDTVRVIIQHRSASTSLIQRDWSSI